MLWIVIIGGKEMRGWLTVWLVGVKSSRWEVVCGGLKIFFSESHCLIDHFDSYEGGFRMGHFMLLSINNWFEGNDWSKLSVSALNLMGKNNRHKSKCQNNLTL